MIEFQNVTFTYQSTERESGVYHLNMTIPDGQVVLLCGESGCGKTTITRLINGLTPEYYEGKLDGTVTVNGRHAKTPLYELSKTVGSVFQNLALNFLMLIQPERLHLAVKILVCQRKKYTDVLGRLRAN